MKNKTMKKAMITSIIALALCFAMLLGTTYAWFTDSVASSGNIIKSGTLNIDLLIKTGTDADYVSVKENPTKKAFDYDKWEPGYTEWVNAKVATTGNLALKYTMKIVANGAVSALADVIDVYYAPSQVAKPAGRDLSGLNKIGTLADALAGTIVINDTLIPGTNEEDFATLALHMQETAGNEYQNLSIGTDFSLQILATQYTYEKDSFDDQYDVNAEYPATAISVATADELNNAIANIANGGKITLTADLDLDSQITIEGKKVTLDFNGKTINNTGELWDKVPGSWSLISVEDGADVTITGGTFDAKENDCYAADVRDGGKLTIDGGTFNGNITAVYVHDGELVINGGEFSIKQLNSPSPYSLLINCLDANYNNGTANYVINGGVFHGFNPAESNSEPGGVKSFLGAGYTVTVDNTQTPAVYTVVAQ